MGRNRKFKDGEIVWYEDKYEEGYGVIVDYQQDKMQRGRYRVQPVSEVNFGMASGRVKWWETWYLKKTDYGFRPRLPGVYKKNQAIPDRGCGCHCCIHVKMERSEVRPDGTFAWDHE